MLEYVYLYRSGPDRPRPCTCGYIEVFVPLTAMLDVTRLETDTYCEGYKLLRTIRGEVAPRRVMLPNLRGHVHVIDVDGHNYFLSAGSPQMTQLSCMESLLLS